MFWLGVMIAVGVIFLLTWFGASMTRRGTPNGWERGRRGNAMIPGPHDDEWLP